VSAKNARIVRRLPDCEPVGEPVIWVNRWVEQVGLTAPVMQC